MIIVNKSPNMVEFEKLSCGEVFRDKYSNICMKIEEVVSGQNMVYLSDDQCKNKSTTYCTCINCGKDFNF